ncbi:MAG: GspMb/PilO family protein [Planctomycetota bacterium]
MRAYRKYVLIMGLVWGCCLVLFVLAYLFVISPRLKVKAELVRQANEKKQMYEAAIDATKEENRKKLTDEVASLKSMANDYVADFESSANLTFDIGRIASEKQVGSFAVKAANRIGGSNKLDSKNVEEKYIDISFESNYRQFATFLNAIERHRPVIFIDRFKVSRSAQSGSQHKVDMGLTIFVRKRTQS